MALSCRFPGLQAQLSQGSHPHKVVAGHRLDRSHGEDEPIGGLQRPSATHAGDRRNDSLIMLHVDLETAQI
jgi:hypothetical protein